MSTLRHNRSQRAALLAVAFALAAVSISPVQSAPPRSAATQPAATLIEKTRVTVRYVGLGKDYADAIAVIAENTLNLYETTYALKMPDRLTIDASLKSDNLLGIWIAGDNAINLTYSHERELAPPRRSKVDTIYGLTYRIADLAREQTLGPAEWLADDAARGLSHYLACCAIDRLYDLHGSRLWPQQYDYVETGWRTLKEEIKQRNAPTIIRAAAVWHDLTRTFSNDAIGKSLNAWMRVGPAPRQPEEAMKNTFVADGRSSHEQGKRRRWFRTFEPLAVWTTAGRRKFERGLSTGRLARDAKILRYDDDRADSAATMAKGGQITTFETPPDQWYLSEVSFHGDRYGQMPRDGKDFVIAIRDEKFRTIATFRKPYGMLRSGGARWHKIPVSVTRLPSRFLISLEFDSTDRVGLRLSTDNSTSGHSASGNIKTGIRPLEDQDWMIRVTIDRRKDDNPLTYRPTT